MQIIYHNQEENFQQTVIGIDNSDYRRYQMKNFTSRKIGKQKRTKTFLPFYFMSEMFTMATPFEILLRIKVIFLHKLCIFINKTS